VKRRTTSILLTVALALASCSNSKDTTGLIKGLEFSESRGSILFHVTIGGTERHLLIQGIPSQLLRTYSETIDQNGGWITDLDVWITSYRHTYSTGNVEYDSIQVFTSVPKDSGNAPRLTPGIVEHELPFQSCRFVGRDGSPLRLNDSTARAIKVGYGKFRFTTSTGSHIGGTPAPHHGP
jgi:hypothetical protein